MPAEPFSPLPLHFTWVGSTPAAPTELFMPWLCPRPSLEAVHMKWPQWWQQCHYLSCTERPMAAQGPGTEGHAARQQANFKLLCFLQTLRFWNGL